MPSDRTVKVNLKGDVSDFNRAMLGASATAKAFTKELDTGTDRATNLTQSILAIGPALVPLGAAGVPVLAGLTNQFAFATLGAGTAALAFSGVGDALKATNDYAIKPTAANLQKMQQSLAELGPAGRDFVAYLQELRPQLQGLQDVAQEGLLPGAGAGLAELMTLLPQVQRIVGETASALGDLFAEGGANLASPRWREFFTFLEDEARPTLIAMGKTLGNFAEGFAQLWMAFDPLSDQFSHSFLEMSRDFAKWSDGLSQTDGFREFIDYIQTNGPRAWDALGAIGNALLQIVEAAAPVGAAALPVIEAVADAIAAIADSDLGPVIIGVISLTSAYSRLIALSSAANSSAIGGMLGKSSFGGAAKAAKDIPAATRAYLQFDAAAARASMTAGEFAVANGRLGASFKGAAKLAGAGGGLAFVMSDLDEKMGLTNTAMGALIGSGFGPMGLAVGATAGAIVDLTHQTDQAAESVKSFTQAFDSAGSLEQQASILADFSEQAETANKILASGIDVGSIQQDATKIVEAYLAAEVQHKADARAADDQKFAEVGLGNAMAFASDETRAETLAIMRNIEAKNSAVDAAENAFSAETNYRQALKDAKKQADTNNAGIRGSSDAALKNRESLDRLAQGWNRVADAGNATTKDMKTAKANFISVAQSMGVSRAAAAKLAAELFHIPSPHPKVVLEGVAGALSQIQHVKDRLLSLDGTTAQTFVQIKESTGKRDGGLVRKFADGGTHNGYVSGPGGPRDDLIDAKISNGEYVVNAFATSRNFDLLQEINSQRYAGGGFVRPSGPAAPTAPHVNVGGGMSRSEFKSVLKEVLPALDLRIVGTAGNQRLKIMGA